MNSLIVEGFKIAKASPERVPLEEDLDYLFGEHRAVRRYRHMAYMQVSAFMAKERN